MTLALRNPPSHPAAARPARRPARPLLWVAAAGCTLAGCAGTPPPDAQMAVSQAAVARAAGPAARDAPVELAAARDRLTRAQVAYADRDYPQARRLAREAEADAVLAEALGRATRADRALAEVREGVRQQRNATGRP